MDIESKKKSELRSLYHHWFPNDKTRGLLLDMQKSVPVQLTNIEFLQPIISTYNPYLKYFIKDLLTLVEPCLPMSVTENICQLAELIASPDKFPLASPKIYTVDDIQMENHGKHFEQQQDKTSKFNDTMDVDLTKTATQTVNGIWKLSTESHSWSLCPIGILPWQ